MVNVSIVKSELLEKMVQAIVKVAEPEKIVLFGSRAKGTAQFDSDYDFLVIKSKSYFEKYSRRKESGNLRRALAKFEVSKDILMYSADEVEQRQNWRNDIVSCALKEGQVLYERS